MKWEYGRKRRGRGTGRRWALVLVLLMLALLITGYVLIKSGVLPWPLDIARAGRGESTQGADEAAGGEDAEYVESQFLMDTYVSIRAVGPGARQAVGAAFDEMRRVEALTSRFVATSDVSRINQGAGGDPVQVSDETFMLLDRALKCSELSGGAFDITIGPVVDAWGFGTDKPHVPDAPTLARALSLVNWRALELNPEGKTVRLPLPGMSIDLGGIAKGYAADRAATVLRDHGIQHALIDAGGNIAAVGTRPDGKPWRIGIRDPRGENPADTIGPVIVVKDAAVVTSGDYERFFVDNGQRYHHIFDPSTGKPASLARSATVIAKNSCDADMLSTAVFVLGPEKGLKVAESLDGVFAMVVGADGNLSFSAGFPGR
ncbi:MAG: FAD:protein FMN transferase [Bacillota bacterium]